MKTIRRQFASAQHAEFLHDLLGGLSLVVLLIVALSVVPVA